MGMEREIIIGVIGLIGVYVFYRMLSGSSMEQIEADPYIDVLNDEKYKVKGQWDK
jgi:hypothetical protein